MTTRYIKGQWNATCDRCGFEYKSGKLRKEWNGLRTCCGTETNNCWEPRHPQDLVRGKTDKQGTEWSRPEPADVDVSVGSGNEISRGDL